MRITSLRITTFLLASFCSIAFLIAILPLMIEGRVPKLQPASLKPTLEVEQELPRIQPMPTKPASQILGNGIEQINDLTTLPASIQKTRERLLEASKTGDIKRLKVVFEMNEMMPIFSRSPTRDPVEYWKKKSGDGEGREVLSALANILNMPAARINIGTPQEMVVFPYLAQLPLNTLTSEQKVDLFRLLTPQDVESMSKFGKYIFFRAGIGKDGTLHYFNDGL